MNPLLEIFSQGEEIVTGHTVDTNSAWLSQETTKLGFTVSRHTAVGDNLADLVELLQEIAQRADCCLCTGGLGPTIDDLTAEAVAQAFALPLIFDEVAYAQIGQFFNQRSRPMPESNRKQALLPKGAIRLDNEWGTAPGFAVQHGKCWFAFMPGVPSEMKPMFLEKVLPNLLMGFSLTPKTLISIKSFGIGESDIQQRLLSVTIPESVQLGFRASLMEVQTKLLFPSDFPKASQAELVSQVAETLGKAVFAIESMEDTAYDLPGKVNELMLSSGNTLAILETVSQGLLASYCLGEWLLESSYKKSLKQFETPANEKTIRQTAEQYTQILQNSSQADYVLVQLFSGGDQSLYDKNQAICVYTLLLVNDITYSTKTIIAGTSKRKQTQAALMALDLLRRYLQFGGDALS